MTLHPLPHDWAPSAGRNTGSTRCILVDGAMQPDWVEKALKSARSQPIALLPTDDEAAKALGPWLLAEETARDIGLTGTDCGINWLDSSTNLSETGKHLARWITFRPPGTERPFYLRLADGRTLSAVAGIWTTRQYADFSRPFRHWCYADRDGQAAMLALPQSSKVEIPASTRMSAEQYERLLDASVPDMLIHALPDETRCQFDGNQEAMHRVAAQMLARLRRIGYEASGEQLEILNAMLGRASHYLQNDHLENQLAGTPHGEALRDALRNTANEIAPVRQNAKPTAAHQQPQGETPLIAAP